ncbi:MAG TPA: thioesterase family protein [Acidimicrobiales bacterium]|nr:thioesterase family protein [Acidimicrobiales bacterium]
MTAAGRYRHVIPVRYGEVDQQGVVFNAHYLAYVDDTMDRWLRTFDVSFEQHGWDVMLKRAEIEWQGPARTGDDLVIDVAVVRWGTTSFDAGFQGTVDERPVFTARVVYVGVRHGTTEPLAAPPAVRALLGEAVPELLGG